MSKPIKVALLSSLIFCSFAFLSKNSDIKIVHAKEDAFVVHSAEELISALAYRNKNILLDDIDLAGQTISLNYDVKLSSSDKTSKISNGYFNIVGPNTIGESIEITLSNLIFDGGVNPSDYDLNQEKSFEEIFGSERDDKCCLNGDFGYYTLNIDNCVITNYASFTGPALYVENLHREDNKNINITNSKFYNNISEIDTLHLSNNKLNINIDSSEFYGNYAYKGQGFSIANGKANINEVNVHDNHFVKYDVNINNPQLCGGGVFIGGYDIKFTNSYIINNETTFGGGLGITTSYAGSKDTIIQNVVIRNNKATYGGGVCAHSLMGQSLIFANCNISFNKATEGSGLYSLVYGHWLASNSGGLIECFFTTFGFNESSDTKAYSFYKQEQTKGSIGTVSLKGCISIGPDTYESDKDSYNYVATKEQALIDNVIDEIKEDFKINKGSKADLKVPSNVYHNWNDLYKDINGDLSIGYSVPKTNKSFDPRLLIFILAPLGALIIILVVIIILNSRKKKSKVASNNENIIEENVYSNDERKEFLATLNERERKVVELTIRLKKRKDIANELNYSENTIKKDLTAIYTKLHVLDKTELVSKYKDLI